MTRICILLNLLLYWSEINWFPSYFTTHTALHNFLYKLESPFLADLFLLGGAGSHQLSIDLPCLFRNEFLVIKGVNSPLLQSKESSAVSVAYNLIRCTFAGQYVEVAF
jgi:hypothetical protein